MKRQVKYDFEGCVALVTGAAKGMGLASAKAFGQARAAVVMADVDIASARTEADKIIKSNGKALAIKYNVADEQEVKAMIDLTVATFGRLDMAYNNAGINTLEVKVVDLSRSDYDRIV
jgi:NAD(P)-dependent dehydrogenase (short-subunit alcohol dehydrogenase family)